MGLRIFLRSPCYKYNVSAGLRMCRLVEWFSLCYSPFLWSRQGSNIYRKQNNKFIFVQVGITVATQGHTELLDDY